jgi:hypothetical protein
MRPLPLALLLALPGLAAADPLGDTVRDAVAARRLRDSDLKGSGAALTPYRELAADGGILVGLEVGLGGTAPAERVAAIRPVYRVAGKTRPGTPAGHFLSDEVTRTVRLVARDGYAVGGLRVAAGRRIDGLAVRFYRVEETGLDSHDAYDSDWVGTTKADGRDLLDGQGRPAVGLFGRTEGDALLGLGLTFADLPVAPSAASPTAAGVGTITPEARAEDPPSSGNTVLAMVVFAVVALPVGLIGVWAARRRPGVQQLPQVVKSVAEINLGLTRPPSIPTDLLLPGASKAGSRPGVPKPDVDRMIALETDSFRN